MSSVVFLSSSGRTRDNLHRVRLTPTIVHFQVFRNSVEYDIKYAIPPFFIEGIFRLKIVSVKEG